MADEAEIKTNGSIKIPKTILTWLFYAAFLVGGAWVTISNSYSAGDGKVLEAKIQQLEKTDDLLREELKSINGKLDRLIEGRNKK